VRWYARNEAIKKSFVKKEGRCHLHRCATCKGLFKRSGVEADHIEPVVPVTTTRKDLTLDEFCANLCVLPDEFQVLCKDCHLLKTEIENEQRKNFKKPKKPTKKKVGKKVKKNRLGTIRK
jgi:hypothetical protein